MVPKENIFIHTGEHLKILYKYSNGEKGTLAIHGGNFSFSSQSPVDRPIVHFLLSICASFFPSSPLLHHAYVSRKGGGGLDAQNPWFNGFCQITKMYAQIPMAQ